MGIQKKNIYSVGQINSYIKNMFTQDILLTKVSVRGEVSNAKYHSSGHIYFTLKDQKGTMACVMFANNRNGLSFPLKEGQEIIVSGSVDVYERSGSYQLYASFIEIAGMGNLYEEFEKMKKRLEERGMFSSVYKREIPMYAKKIGIVTARTGAAVRDIIQIATRRNPFVQLILYPAIVQGAQAADSIVSGIHMLEKNGVELIIVGRGGGSLEDLWAFNEEKVAQAIFDCSVPTISAVGHETDHTIADFVADLRAPTPSAAAELAVYMVADVDKKLRIYKETYRRIVSRKIEIERSHTKQYQLKLLHGSPQYRVKENRMYALQLLERMQKGMDKNISSKRHRLELFIMRLKGVSPLDKLSAGYAYATDKSGNPIRDIEQVSLEDQIAIDIKNGVIVAKVLEKQKVERGEK